VLGGPEVLVLGFVEGHDATLGGASR
jgi:hypothetical protein